MIFSLQVPLIAHKKTLGTKGMGGRGGKPQVVKNACEFIISVPFNNMRTFNRRLHAEVSENKLSSKQVQR